MTAAKVNTSYGLQGRRDRAEGKPGTVDVTRMDAYNRTAPWGQR